MWFIRSDHSGQCLPILTDKPASQPAIVPLRWHNSQGISASLCFGSGVGLLVRASEGRIPELTRGVFDDHGDILQRTSHRAEVAEVNAEQQEYHNQGGAAGAGALRIPCN